MNEKILIVDDDPAARRILTLLLKSAGTVFEASSGAEALRLVETEKPRLMLLDMTMPGMSGLEVLQCLHAAAVRMTVIMLTGQNDIELATRALELGAAEYITKPFDLAHLKEKVKHSLETALKDKKRDGGLPWRILDPGGTSTRDAE